MMADKVSRGGFMMVEGGHGRVANTGSGQDLVVYA